MKIGDLVKYIADSEDFGANMFGVIEKIDACATSIGPRIWIRWFDSAELQWARADHLEVQSEAR